MGKLRLNFGAEIIAKLSDMGSHYEAVGWGHVKLSEDNIEKIMRNVNELNPKDKRFMQNIKLSEKWFEINDLPTQFDFYGFKSKMELIGWILETFTPDQVKKYINWIKQNTPMLK